MKKIKTILAFALALNMCVSLAACGKTDGGEKDDAKEKVTTTAAAESVSEESESKDEAVESEAETEATTTAAEAESESEAITENISDIVITELEPYISEMAGKDIDTAEGILKDVLNITATRTEAGPYLDNWMYYEWELPKDITIGGVHFDDVALTTTDNAVDSFSLGIEYEDENTALDERRKIRYDIFGSQGYNMIGNSAIDENPELSEYRGGYTLSCGYASVDIDRGNNKRVLIQISDLH